METFFNSPVGRFLRHNRLVLLGTLLGAGLGYLYYFFVGCASGTCAISSNPVNSTLYFAAMGALFFHTFVKDKAPKA